MLPPADRITLIRRSVRCFWWSVFSFIPGLGMIFAATALVQHGMARRLARGEWNPAGRYLLSGLLLATFGGLFSAIVFLIFLFQRATNVG